MIKHIKPFLIPAIICFSVLFVLRYLNLIPGPPENYKPNGMVYIRPFCNMDGQMDFSGYKKWGIFLIKQEDLGKRDKDGREVVYISLDGRSYPKGRSGDKPDMLITEVSKDRDYGCSEKPIKVGGAEKKEGPASEQRYLNSLYGPNGETIRYERIGSCCPFKAPNGHGGIGFLDMFKITYKGLKEPIILHLDMYNYEEPEAPYGFSINPKRINKKT